MNLRRLLLLAVVAALVAGFFASGLQQHLSLDALKAQQQVLDQQVTNQPILASALYVGCKYLNFRACLFYRAQLLYLFY